MNKRRFVILMCLPWCLAALALGPGQGHAQAPKISDLTPLERMSLRLTQADRKAAAKRMAAQRAANLPGKAAPKGKQPGAAAAPAATAMAMPMPGGTPNYFGPEPNWSYSPAPTVDPARGAISGGIRKFVNGLPGLTAAGANDLGQFIPVANPDTVTYPGSDYYEIELREYTEKMHSDLNPTTLRGYVQVNKGTDPAVAHPTAADNTVAPAPIQYLGPLVIARKDRPVRVKFTNKLATGAGGDLFLPVDKTEMGAGMGPLGMNTTPGWPMNYTENRGTLHLHGGRTPWISDGTPHQWITPAHEQTDYPEGVSVQNVPDMPDPGPGSMTFFYTNQQSARLMFYHDHAYGITRLNVYAGEAAGYLVTDPTEQDLIARGILPDMGIPLVIQDKTFVDPTTVLTTDPTWPFPVDALKSNLWYPHVYMPNQNPNDMAGANAMGRWDYGPWFWPPWPVTMQPITDPVTGVVTPNLPDLSMTMEAYHDTPLVNGTVYPTLTVQPKAYRFRILNAANDRMWNLQLYKASPIVGGITLTNGGGGYTDAPMVTISPAPGDTTGKGATATATIDAATSAVVAITLDTVGSGYTLPPIVTIAPPATTGGTPAMATASIYTTPTEVGMVPAVRGAANFPSSWTVQTIGQPGDILDGRSGGVPDPAMMGPSMIQIGTEGGFLPAPVVWPNIPIGFERNIKNIVVTNVKEHNLFIGPAERADVIIDFSAFAGKTIILYNDAGAAVPAADCRLDYYTADQDQTDTGGTVPTLPGYGPNTRTIMQFQVANTAPAPAYNLAALKAEFATTPATGAPGVFARSQEPIIVPQAGYNSAYNAAFPADTTAYARIQSTSLTFTPLGATAPVTIQFQPKAIQELFENTYGRMAAYLGVELPFTNSLNQTTIDYGYIDPPTEIVNETDRATPIGSLGDGTQIWKITHNGVDTHPIHFHLFDVQLINRVGWDGAITPPEANELGWKETVRMNPLEDCIVAFRAVAPKPPFGVPDSIRPLDPTMPIGSTMGFRNVDPITGKPITVINQLLNYGWEYVWHCHILSHEEMDMMRAIVFNVARTRPAAPILSVTTGAGQVSMSWTDATNPNPAYPLPGNNWGNPANEIGFRIERAIVDKNGMLGAYSQIGKALANVTGYNDATAAAGVTYSYRVVAFNAAGGSPSNPVLVGPPVPPAAPSGLTANITGPHQIDLAWSYMQGVSPATGLRIERASGAGAFTALGTVAATSTTFSDTAAPDGKTLNYRVIAFNATGDSAPSNTATVNLPLAAPLNPAAALAAQPPLAVGLTWVNNSLSATGLTVQRATNAAFTTALVTYTVTPGTATAYLDNSNLAVNATYYYRICTTLGAISSAWSATVSVITAPPTGTLSLSGMASPLSANPPTVTLAWGSNVSNAGGFTVQRATNSNFSQGLVSFTVPGGSATGYIDTTPQVNTRYYYRVRAFNAAGSSAWSNSLTINTPGQLPLDPTNLAIVTAQTTRTSLRISWTDNATNEQGFYIERSIAGFNGPWTRIATVGANTTVYTNTGLTRNATYWYRVQAYNAAGTSGYTNVISGTTLP